ncbi:MAG: leucyl/phenylalanyl-tRNA--protein transferase [Cryobacterium sp.]|nr:leucyl/phenylalanyl-tRNA--protein transferase [Oligoflexia bacterium]
MSLSSSSKFPVALLSQAKTGDVLATSAEVWPDLLVDAYEHGIFPWPSGEEDLIPWCSPKKRALLFFNEMKLPKSLSKAKRKAEEDPSLVITRDTEFGAVIRACANKPRPGQPGTWITSAMIEAYEGLHQMGRAHSVEVWRVVDTGKNDGPSADGLETRLIAGIYGVDCGGAFSAESMFYEEPNASKIALLFLIERLKEKGCEWLDIQQLTPHLEKLGAREIKRSEYLQLLSQAQASQGGKIF